MRRPLCYICMAFVVTVFIMLCIGRIPDCSYDTSFEGKRVVKYGEVTAKEYKNGSLIVYLKQEDGCGLMCCMVTNKEPKLGSIVAMEGTATNFMEARNPGGFDQKSYYRLQGIHYQLRNAQIVSESSKYNSYMERLYQLRRRMERTLEHCMDEKDASIMKAMILGNKTELDRDSKQLYQKSGIAHVLAISGLHISLLGMGLYKLLKKLRIPTVLSACIAVFVMLAYGDMVGMSSSAYRAIFMFGMKMGAELLHRTYDMLTALALAAVGILIEQPMYLHHVGFLLSFGAIIGIGCMLDVIKTDMTQMSFCNKGTDRPVIRYLNRKLNKMQEGICGSLSIFTIHFPIMLEFYYEFPVYSFLLNLLIIPSMGLLMVLGLGCILLGSISMMCMQGTAKLLAACCHVMLMLFERLCELSLALPGAWWITGRPDHWRIACFYFVMLLLFGLHKYSREKTDGKLCLPFAIKMMWILATVIVLTQNTYGNLKITALDVGQGDGIWLETDTGHHYLIDGGSTSRKKIGEYTLVPFLKYMGTDTLDAVFLTHLDEDHISGVMELLEDSQGIIVKRVVIAKAVIQDEAYEMLVRECEEQGVSVEYAVAGNKITDGELTLEVLHPSSDYKTDSRNACSLVMALDYRNFHALFTGDVEADGEAVVRNELPDDWDCHLYKAAHHGSKYSNTEELIAQIKPRLALISCSEDNSYGHPHKEVLERLDEVGSEVLITKDTGAVMLQVNGDKIKVETFIQ